MSAALAITPEAKQLGGKIVHGKPAMPFRFACGHKGYLSLIGVKDISKEVAVYRTISCPAVECQFEVHGGHTNRKTL